MPSRCKPKYIKASRQVVLKPMSETSVLVSTLAACLIEVAFHEKVAKNNASMTGNAIIDCYRGFTPFLTISKFDKVEVNLPKHQKVGAVLNALQKIVHNKEEHFSYPLGTK